MVKQIIQFGIISVTVLIFTENQSAFKRMIKIILSINNFKTSLVYKQTMNPLLPEIQQYKDRIPEFLIKLYHILEKKQHEQYLTWFGEDQILIKQPKKFQEKVLPRYFRHKHLSSFIRQLNMYKFSKVSKILKQKNHMYFKNPYFQRGQMYSSHTNLRELLLKIKRNTKKNRDTEESIVPKKIDQMSNSQNLSINEKLQQIQKDHKRLAQYKKFVQKSVLKIQQIISKFFSNPQLQNELKPITFICEQLLELKKDSKQSFQGGYSFNGSYDQLSLLNCSQRIFPSMDVPSIYPSQCSLYSFNSINKI